MNFPLFCSQYTDMKSFKLLSQWDGFWITFSVMWSRVTFHSFLLKHQTGYIVRSYGNYLSYYLIFIDIHYSIQLLMAMMRTASQLNVQEKYLIPYRVPMTTRFRRRMLTMEWLPLICRMSSWEERVERWVVMKGLSRLVYLILWISSFQRASLQ